MIWMCHKWSQKIPDIHKSSLPIVYKERLQFKFRESTNYL